MGISPTPTLILILTLLSGLVLAGGTDLPVEPVIIGSTTQFLVDDYLVDNRFALKYARESPENGSSKVPSTPEASRESSDSME